MYHPNTITNLGSKAKPEVTYPVNQSRPLARFLYYTPESITRKKLHIYPNIECRLSSRQMNVFPLDAPLGSVKCP